MEQNDALIPDLEAMSRMLSAPSAIAARILEQLPVVAISVETSPSTSRENTDIWSNICVRTTSSGSWDRNR